MKIEIWLLAWTLFWHFQLVLDLETGQIYNPLYEAEKIRQLKHKRLIPCYSKAPIYQEYSQIIHDRFGFPLGEWFYQYPKFEFIPNHVPENVADFLIKRIACAMALIQDRMISPFRILEPIWRIPPFNLPRIGVKRRGMNGMMQGASAIKTSGCQRGQCKSPSAYSVLSGKE